MQNKISVVLFEFWSHISSSSTPVCALLWLHSIFQYLYCSHPLECGMLLMMTWTLIEPHSYIFTENAHMIFVFPSFKQVEKISWFLFPFIRIQKRPWKTVFVSWLEASDVRKSSEGRKFPFNSSSSTVECALQEMQRLNSKGWRWRKASSDQSRESFHYTRFHAERTKYIRINRFLVILQYRSLHFLWKRTTICFRLGEWKIQFITLFSHSFGVVIKWKY